MSRTLHPSKTRRSSTRRSSNDRQATQEELRSGPSLSTFLERVAKRDRAGRALATLLSSLAEGAVQIAELVSLGSIAGRMSVSVGAVSGGGDAQKQLDVLANDVFMDALRRAPVAAILSEELLSAVALDSAAPFAVAIDPLDGSSNIDANISIGTIFSILPSATASHPDDHFLRPGHNQIAAGFVIYGPQTSLVLTIREGVQVFTLDRRSGVFRLVMPRIAIPEDSTEYAVNASNYRHWDDSVRAYIDDCLQGVDGPLFRDHNMRWIASLVADAYRILIRGGVFLYPADQRRGYGSGRLRLIYEANPISLLAEQAGGGATDTVQRILDIHPRELHSRTPIVFGSFAAVQRISRYHTDPQFSAERAPLFFQRGLIRR